MHLVLRLRGGPSHHSSLVSQRLSMKKQCRGAGPCFSIKNCIYHFSTFFLILNFNSFVFAAIEHHMETSSSKADLIGFELERSSGIRMDDSNSNNNNSNSISNNFENKKRIFTE